MRTMKDSGIPWIGEIPEGWGIDTIGNLYTLRTEKVSDKDYAPLSVTKMGIVPQLEAAAKTDDGDNRKLVRVGDFAINSRSDRRGSCGISAYDGSVSLINLVLTPRGQMYPRFYNWLFHTELFADEFYKWGHGIVDDLWTTRWQEMKRISIVSPSYQEQQRIAEFLDRKCAEVDEMIALQEQIIEELKAYKQSVITEAVTKGLNPAAPMRDSGIEWIGSIPEHWSTKRLKDVGYLYGGLTGKAGDDFIAEDDETCQYMRFIPYTNIFNNYLINPAQLYKVRIEEGEKQNLVNKGDILFLMSSEDYDGVGKPAMIDMQVDNLGLNSFCKGFRITDNGTYPKYLLYLLLSHTLREMVRQEGKGFIRINLRQDKLSTCPIILPDITEQQAIADYLDEKCADIDSLIQTKQSKIDSLKEYKKSIIYEYVTGKREVE